MISKWIDLVLMIKLLHFLCRCPKCEVIFGKQTAKIKHEIWKAIVQKSRISNLEFRKKVTKMKILVMMCLASAIASVTQSDPQPKGKLELKIQKTFNFLRKLLYTRK